MIDRFSQQHSKLSFYQCHCVESHLNCLTSIFLKIWNGRESHKDIKVCSKRQTASIVLFSGFPAWNHNILQSFG